MGNKLVAMVRIFFILFSFSLLEANDDSVTIIEQDKALYKLHVDPLINEARIYKIIGDGKSFQLQQSYVGKPKKRDLKKTNLVTKRDRYILKFTDSDNNTLMRLGIGDPFTAYAQHIGYEDSERFSFQVGQQEISAVIPIQITPSNLIIEKRDINDVFNEISIINLDIQ